MGLPQGGPASAQVGNTEGALRVLLVDEHELLREAMQSILVRGIEVVGIAKNAAQAVSSVSLHSPDVVLLCVKAKSIQEESGTARALATLASTNGHFSPAAQAAPNGEYLVVQHGADTQPQGHDQTAAALVDLTPRERQVLTLLIGGASNKEMARRLSIRSNTVRTHVQSVLTKLRVHTRLGAATLALRHGLLKPEDAA